MGNKPAKWDRWSKVNFHRTAMHDINAFCQELARYNSKINELRSALESAERNLILYLGLNELESELGKDFHMSVQDATMSIFYSFASFFKGDYKRMLDLKFHDEPPYIEVNVHYLEPILKDAWMVFQKFMDTLEATHIFCKALISKYKQYYKDYYERYLEYLDEVDNAKQLSEMDRMKHNY